MPLALQMKTLTLGRFGCRSPSPFLVGMELELVFPDSAPVALFDTSCPTVLPQEMPNTLFKESDSERKCQSVQGVTLCDMRAVEPGDVFSHFHSLRKTQGDNTNIYPGHLPKMTDELDELVKK